LLFLSSLGTLAQGDALLAQNHPNLSLYSNAGDPSGNLGRTSPSTLGPDAQKLLARAQKAFAKMRYARAARHDGQLLSRADVPHSAALLSMAADAHYYSGDLRSAHGLYQEMAQQFGDPREGGLDKTPGDSARRQRAARVHGLLAKPEIGPVENDSVRAGERVPRIQIRNLGFNSRYSDFAPMFHQGNQLVFASSRDTGTVSKRRYKRNKQPFLDLYVADAQSEGATTPRKFSQVLNTKYHEASVAFSKDEKTLYFTRNNYGKRLKRQKDRDVAHLKIFRSTLVNGQWT